VDEKQSRQASLPVARRLTRFCQKKNAGRDPKTRDLSKTRSTMNRVTLAAKSMESLLAKCRYSDENNTLLNPTGQWFQFGGVAELKKSEPEIDQIC
jgi:hypothetical protein